MLIDYLDCCIGYPWLSGSFVLVSYHFLSCTSDGILEVLSVNNNNHQIQMKAGPHHMRIGTNTMGLEEE